ncbi:hypothetical protein G6F22_018770 [Rhizopus arrhizus]|nr:hypothetical protein G6F22_018770 [Rhizopus arrhizus]
MYQPSSAHVGRASSSGERSVLATGAATGVSAAGASPGSSGVRWQPASASATGDLAGWPGANGSAGVPPGKRRRHRGFSASAPAASRPSAPAARASTMSSTCSRTGRSRAALRGR